MLLRTLLALVAGASLSLAFEPVGLVLFAPVALAGLALCVRGLPAKRAWLPGLAFGAGFFYPLLFWLRVVGVDVWLGVAALEAVYLAVLGAIAAALMRLPAWPLWFAAAWTSMELLRGSWPFGGFPWGRLAFATVDTPFSGALPWVGATGVGFLLALLGATLAWGAVEVRRRPRPAFAAVAAAGLVATLPALASYDVEPVDTVNVAAVQGDVPGRGDDILLDHRQVTANHVEATVDLAAASGPDGSVGLSAAAGTRPDFVVWPENSTAVDPFRDAEVNAGIRAASEAIGVPILVGAIVDGPKDGQVLNQGIVWDPETGGGDRYTKRHPVPFGEYIPFRNSWITEGVSRLDLVPRDMLGGTGTAPLRIGGALVADAICFDVAYDDGIHAQVREGAQLLVVQTSNAMFIHTDQIEQQYEISRLRALETGRYTVVAAVNGVSGIIGPDGTVLQEADARTRTVLQADVGLVDELTPAVRLSPWLARGAVALTLLGLVLAALAYRRGSRNEETA
ncbi:apolipoprotein N-acyltransferase [Nocardioides pacificus]